MTIQSKRPDSPNHGTIVLYQAKDGQTTLDVQLRDETVWLTQAQMVELFQREKRTVSEHIRNIFKEGELNEDAVVRKSRTTAADGKSYLTAVSDPPRKELMIRLIVNLLNNNPAQQATEVSDG